MDNNTKKRKLEQPDKKQESETKQQTEKEKKEKIIRYESRVMKVKEDEIKNGAYQTGIVFTKDFSLIYGSEEKHCDIPDAIDAISGLPVHTTQAIIEAFVAAEHRSRSEQKIRKNVNDLPGILFVNEGNNFLLINIGCVISDNNNDPLFISKPVFLENKQLVKIDEQGKHSEDLFIKHYLKEKDKLKILIRMLLKDEVKDKRQKIHALVLDLHSSQDLCDGCEKEIFKFQEEETQNIIALLTSMRYDIPKDDFKIVFRVSSVLESRGLRAIFSNRDEKLRLARTYTHTSPMNLKNSDGILILHSDKEMREKMAKWYERETYRNLMLFTPLPRQTIFINRYGTCSLSPPEYIPTKQDVKEEIAVCPLLKTPITNNQEATIADIVVDYLAPRPST